MINTKTLKHDGGGREWHEVCVYLMLYERCFQVTHHTSPN